MATEIRPCYKWRLLLFLFVAFFLELGTRQLYNAVLPQIAAEMRPFGVTDTQLGAVGSVFGAVFGFASLCVFYLLGAAVLVPAIAKFFKRDYIGGDPQSSQESEK